MKKFVFLLTLIAATLLMMTVAFAAHPCDSCGASDTSLVGSGAWCHWDCNKCGYRTSRNHNPNSYNSGLVPDSCAGRCQWCGASAAFSSHSFTTWLPAGDATCTADGREVSNCANEGCSATTRRDAPGSALGHEYKEIVHYPMCEEIGYTSHKCIRCDEHYNDNVVRALGHAYTRFAKNGDGTHTARCTRGNCDQVSTASCGMVTQVVGGTQVSFCPICGDTNPPIAFEQVENPADDSKLPGQVLVMVDAAPLDAPLYTDAFYLFVTSLQQDGVEVPLTQTITITVDLNRHPFSMPDSIFFEMPVYELNARAFKIVRVEQEMVGDQPVEVWHEVPFTLENGVLTFDTDKMGVFLMVLNIVEAPSVG